MEKIFLKLETIFSKTETLAGILETSFHGFKTLVSNTKTIIVIVQVMVGALQKLFSLRSAFSTHWRTVSSLQRRPSAKRRQFSCLNGRLGAAPQRSPRALCAPPREQWIFSHDRRNAFAPRFVGRAKATPFRLSRGGRLFAYL
jgi:hypothetical protein